MREDGDEEEGGGGGIGFIISKAFDEYIHMTAQH